MSSFNYIDLFAGAGGLSEGFIRAGFEPIAHVEIDKAACYTLKTRTAYHYLKSVKKYDTYVSYLKGEITRKDLYSLVPAALLDAIINLPIGSDFNPSIHKTIEKQILEKEVDLIIGGPPCQAYSLVGRARSANGMSGDPRNYLYVQYAKYLEKYNPKMFVFENVLGLKSAKEGLYLRNMEKLLLKKGYNMKLFTVEANNFGVLQNRKRIIIIGWKESLTVTIPNLESIRKNVDCKVKSLFADLPKIQAGEGTDKFLNYRTKTNDYLDQSFIRNGIDILTQHIARPHTKQDKEIYRIAVDKWNSKKERLNYNDLPERLKTHQNRSSFFDRFKVVAADELHSQTVVAHIAKDGHYYIHPDIEQNRSITVREAARLQSFPDDYYFEGVKESANRTAAFKQIGNAVPPLMAFEIALIMKKILKCQ
jgi:DNA (cytosine-5)-methyltransferase 1